MRAGARDIVDEGERVDSEVFLNAFCDSQIEDPCHRADRYGLAELIPHLLASKDILGSTEPSFGERLFLISSERDDGGSSER